MLYLKKKKKKKKATAKSGLVLSLSIHNDNARLFVFFSLTNRLRYKWTQDFFPQKSTSVSMMVPFIFCSSPSCVWGKKEEEEEENFTN